MTDSLTDLLLKPAGPLAAGGVLFGAVWGFFKGVESVLNQETLLEIWMWLGGVKVGQQIEPWPETFAKLFDRVFGAKHLTWRSFWRSAMSTTATIVLMASTIGPALTTEPSFRGSVRFLLVLIPVALVPDYISLLMTRKLDFLPPSMKRDVCALAPEQRLAHPVRAGTGPIQTRREQIWMVRI